MAIKVGINGYGRIGRNIMRALYESKRTKEIQIIAINDLGDTNTNAHLTQYDTAHGKFPGSITIKNDSMIVNGDKVRVLSERDPSKLPWGELGVDVVLESTGFFTSKAKAQAHINAGAKKLLYQRLEGVMLMQPLYMASTMMYCVQHIQLFQMRHARQTA